MNKMIKKSVSVFLVLLIFLSAVGCTNQSEEPETTSDATTTEATVETTTELVSENPEPTLDEDQVISEYQKIMSEYDQTDIYTNYSLYDIDKNDLPELFIWHYDTSDHTKTADIYSFDNGSTFKLITINHDAFNIATIPDKNGIMILGWDDTSDFKRNSVGCILSIENRHTVKEKIIIDDERCLTIDEKKFPNFSTMEMLNDGGDPSILIKNSEWVDYYPMSDLFMLSVCFDKYTNEKPAYKKIIENYRNKPLQDSEDKCTKYSLYDIDNNGITELILISKNEDYNGLHGSIYTILDDRIKYCGNLSTTDVFYNDSENDGLLCKGVYKDGTDIVFSLYEFKNGVFSDYPKFRLSEEYEYSDDGDVLNHKYYDNYIHIDEDEYLARTAQFKEIKAYNIDNLSALDLL